MRLCDLPFPVYGDTSYRGKCPTEALEQVTFFGRVRERYPDTWGLLALHPRNEGLKTGGHLRSVAAHQAEGMVKGAADIIVPGGRGMGSFVCELKRLDHTLSAWQEGQIEYLTAAHKAGAFVCVALGYDAAWEAFEEWVAGQ